MVHIRAIYSTAGCFFFFFLAVGEQSRGSRLKALNAGQAGIACV